MKNNMSFSEFKNKYIISGKLNVETALHISSGIEEGEKDAPFITADNKSESKKFYIPGSSFRGYLRSQLERLLSKENKFIFFIDKNEDKTLNEGEVKLIFGYTNLLKTEKKDGKDKYVEDEDVIRRVLEEFLENNVIDRILKDKAKKDEEVQKEGKKYSSMAGKIHISDMEIIDNVDSVQRDGIEIDRETGATKRGGKFNYDIIPAETKFKFEMELDNIEEYQLDLIKLALINIREGDLFGGKLSRGIGKCKLEIEKIEYVDITNIEDYILKNEKKTLNVDEFFEKINLKIK
jgi:hypothetical protein